MVLNNLLSLLGGTMLLVGICGIANYQRTLANLSDSVCGNFTSGFDVSALAGSCDLYCYMAIAGLVFCVLGGMHQAIQTAPQSFRQDELTLVSGV